MTAAGRCGFAASVLASLLLLLSAVAAAAQVSLTPTRIVFDRGGRTLSLTVTNTDSVPRTFDLALVDRIMTPDGRVITAEEAIADPALAPIAESLASARPLLLVTPPRVTIEPGRSQTVRVRASVPSTPAAEHRTHLTVTALPPADAGVTVDQALTPGQFAMRLNVAVGLSVPVIVRSGRPDLRAGIADLSIVPVTAPAEPGVPAQQAALARLSLQRLGASSLYGNVEVRGRDGALIGQVSGVGVYPEIAARRVEVPLSRMPRADERLSVIFVDGQDQVGRRLAEASFPSR